MELNRRDKILKLIVEQFIKTANPVGSQTLIEEFNLPYSSATIRNEMFALEKDGLLEKTHTSSGRVPSSKGYRYYIDHLRKKDVDQDFKLQLQNVLSQKVQSIEDVIKESCEILANMTNLASVSLGPSVETEHLVSIQLIPISANSATAVFVTDQGYVANKTFITPDKMNLDDINKCISLLNDRLKGTSIIDVVSKMESLRPLLNDYIINHDVIYQAMLEAFLRFASDRLSLYGKDELLDQPEFAHDAEKLKKIISLLDSPEVFKKRSNQVDNEVYVDIGADIDGFDDVSIITAKLTIPGNDNKGTIALVGPKRMDYEKVLNSIEYVVKELDKYFFERTGEKNWKKKK